MLLPDLVHFLRHCDISVNSIFVTLIEQLHPSFDRLMAMVPVRNGCFDGSVPKRGVYLFSELGNGHFYVGRSVRLQTNGTDVAFC